MLKTLVFKGKNCHCKNCPVPSSLCLGQSPKISFNLMTWSVQIVKRYNHK